MLIFLSQGSNCKIYIFNVYINILEGKKIKMAGTCFLTDCIYFLCPIANLYKRMDISAKRKKNSSSASKSSLFSSTSQIFHPTSILCLSLKRIQRPELFKSLYMFLSFVLLLTSVFMVMLSSSFTPFFNFGLFYCINV